MKKITGRTIGRVSTLLLYTGFAHAQGEAASAESAASAPEEIIVTARKREERLQDVPVVMTAISGAVLQRYAITSLSDVSKMAPGLIVANTQNNTGGTMTIRGIGATAQNPAVDQAVSTNVDGVQVSQAAFLRLGLFDVGQVEVLKGPQSLFFGKNSTAGIISLTSNDPGSRFESHVTAGYEFEQERKYGDLVLSGPLNEVAGARLFLYAADQNGWFRNAAADVAVPGVSGGSRVKTASKDQEFAGRLTVKLVPDGVPFEGRFKASYNKVQRDSGSAAMSQKFLCPLGVSQLSAAQLTGGVAPSTDDCKIDRNFVSADPLPGLAALASDITPYPKSEFTQVLTSFEGNLHLGSHFKLTSVTAYYQLDAEASDMFTNSDAAVLAGTADDANEQVTQELRFASDFGGLVDFVVGGFYQDARLRDNVIVAADVIMPRPTLLSDTHYRQATRSNSAFAEITLRPMERIDFAIGGRYTDEEKKFSGTARGVPIVVRRPVNSYSDFSLQSTVRYRPTDDAMLFASYREAFIAGGFDFNPVPPAFGPTTDISYNESTVDGVEAGYKAGFLDDSLRLEASVFRYQYADMQLSARDAITLSLTTLNAGKATVQGAELSIQWSSAALPGLTLSGSGAYTDAQYDQFIASCYTGQSIAQGCNLRPNASGAFTSQDLRGQDLARAPELTANLGISQEFAMSRSLESILSLGASYSSAFETTVENDPRARHESYVLLNSSLSIRDSSSTWQLSLIGRNLTNKLIRPNSFSSPFSGARTGTANPVPSDLFGVVGSPREVALQLRWSF